MRHCEQRGYRQKVYYAHPVAPLLCWQSNSR
jgi:hypothetical protein